LQWLPGVHDRQVAPPQSTPVSFPLCTRSPHDACWHTPAAHTDVVQSDGPPQCWPTPHAMHRPPQSTSVSVPLRSPSLHVAA
jgi:hypothetical protein